MKTLIIGKQGAGKTSLLIKLLVYMKKPILFFSELPKSGLEALAKNIGVELSEVELIEQRPSIDAIIGLSQSFETIIIDHWRRIKDADTKKQRNKLYDYLEKSNKDWWILAHTLKGAEPDDLASGRWISGLDSVVDVALGLSKIDNYRLLKVLKDRYYVFKGKEYLLGKDVLKLLDK